MKLVSPLPGIHLRHVRELEMNTMPSRPMTCFRTEEASALFYSVFFSLSPDSYVRLALFFLPAPSTVTGFSFIDIMVRCYYLKDGIIKLTEYDRGLCSDSLSANGFYACCNPDHVCLPGAMCYNPDPAAKDMAFYLSTCSDPDYLDPNCPNKCGMI